MARITIVGLGLIGGSLGLALRRAQIAHELVGYDADPAAARAAQRRDAIDRVAGDLSAAVDGARLVILATPVLAMRDLLASLGPLLAPGCIVTDTASTKTAVLRWAAELLPAVAFVGGHPMAGKETSGIAAAEETLFDGAVYCVVPPPDAPAEAVATVADLARAVGAEPYFLSPEEHDSYVAAVSHLPFLAATALVSTTAAASSWRDMAALAANGFRDASRLAAGDPVMYRDICATNREPILHWLDRYADRLGQIRALVAEGGAELEALFAQARRVRQEWEQQRRERSQTTSTPSPRFGERLSRLVLGGLDRWTPRS